MYKYQEKTVKELEKSQESIEKMTNEEYQIPIGKVIYDNFECVLFMCINHNVAFKEYMIIDGCTFMDHNKYGYNNALSQLRGCLVHINKNVFLKLNELIDTIIQDNKERERFYERLNAQLEALNETLETQ